MKGIPTRWFGLRIQLLFFLTLLIGASMGVTGVLIIQSQTKALTEAITSKGQAMAFQLAGILAEPLEGGDRLGYSKILHLAKASDPSITDVLLVHPTDRTVLAALNPDVVGSVGLPEYPRTIPFPKDVLDSRDHHVIATVHLWMDTRLIEEEVGKAKREIIRVTGVFLLLAVLLSVVLADRIVKPIRRLVQGVEEMGRGNFDVKVPVTSRNEVGQLTEAFNETAKSLKEKEHLKSVAKSYMGQEVVDQAMQTEGEVQMGGERKLVTILFSDIRDFTALSEHMKPEQVVSMLNEYFSEMTAIIVRRGGFVDKFMGDAVMAVFGVPKPRADHAELAVVTAVEMLQRLAVLQREWEAAGKPVIKMGIGLNTGEVVAGNIGSKDRVSYTIIGDPANVASRVQALNKTYHTTLLLTDRTYAAVTGKVPYVLQPVEKAQIRGRNEPVQLFTIRV